MTKTEDEYKAEWKHVDSECVNQALDCLRQHDVNIHEYLASIIASLCDVTAEEMFSNKNTLYMAQARWLFWYAYRYMTNETYEKMSLRVMRLHGKKFTPQGVGMSINKMSQMIDTEPLWAKRWSIAKKIIKLRERQDEVKEDNTIVIQVPRDIKDNVNIVIKDK